jgi:hypothetical protein
LKNASLHLSALSISKLYLKSSLIIFFGIEFYWYTFFLLNWEGGWARRIWFLINCVIADWCLAIEEHSAGCAFSAALTFPWKILSSVADGLKDCHCYVDLFGHDYTWDWEQVQSPKLGNKALGRPFASPKTGRLT